LALVQGITCAARSSSNTRGGLLVAIKMQIRRGTLAAWAAASNPVLEPGELGFVTDVGKTAFKIGDTAGTGWNTLPYVNSTYPELLPDAGGNLDLSIAQGRYQLLSGVTYTNVPTTDFTDTTTDGNCLLFVTVPSTTIVIQELTTSLTTCKRFIRAKNNSTWTAWKRIDNLSASESLSITNLTLTGRLFVPPGSAVAPSITITGDTTTGIYQSAAQELGIATNGVSRVRVGDSLATITTGLTVSSTLTASNALTVSSGAVTLPTGSVAGAALANNGVTVAKLAQVAVPSFLGTPSGTASATNVSALTQAQSRTMLGLIPNAYTSPILTSSVFVNTNITGNTDIFLSIDVTSLPVGVIQCLPITLARGAGSGSASVICYAEMFSLEGLLVLGGFDLGSPASFGSTSTGGATWYWNSEVWLATATMPTDSQQVRFVPMYYFTGTTDTTLFKWQGGAGAAGVVQVNAALVVMRIS
jgi:hypothetical protein